MDPKNLKCDELAPKYKTLCSNLSKRKFDSKYGNVAEYYFPELKRYFSPYQVKLNKDGFTGNKNVDMLLLNKMNDETLTNVCLVNKYVYSLCQDDNFWFKRFLDKFQKGYDNLEEIKKWKGEATWKEYYLWMSDLLDTPYPYFVATSAFNTGRDDVLKLLDRFYDVRVEPFDIKLDNAQLAGFFKIQPGMNIEKMHDEIRKVGGWRDVYNYLEKHRVGPYLQDDPNGRIEAAYLDDGKYDGIYNKYFPHGALEYEANYNLGNLDGEAKTYANNGDLLKTEIYDNGRLIETLHYFRGKVIRKERAK
jgi:hypothetical protein